MPLRPPIVRLLAALVAVLVGASCATAPPTPQELVSVGFRDPRQTFATFQSAVGADLVDLEYRCYSEEFKREWDITQGNYRVARKELFAQMPWVRRIARAEVRGEEVIDPTLVRLDARVTFLLQKVDVEVYLRREDFYELWVGNERVSDGVLSFPSAVRRVSEDGATPWDRVEMVLAEVALESPVPPAVARRLDEVTELRVGREWRIAGMRLVADE